MSSDVAVYQNGDPGGFNGQNINLDSFISADNLTDIICYLYASDNEYNDKYFGARISSVFVVFFVSTAVTFFPVFAARSEKIRIPNWIYLVARYFGSGVIVATAFVHLLDPAYGEIGPNTCVGMTGGWASYSWVPAIALTSCMVVFLMDVACERYVEEKYGLAHAVTGERADIGLDKSGQSPRSHQNLHSGDQDMAVQAPSEPKDVMEDFESTTTLTSAKERKAEMAFREQIAAFLILEFGVIFHSVIIGLNLGSTGSEFKTLYPVIVFHQSFEGLGIGARLSAIPFPKRLRWMPWALCAGYGLTTPISIAIGIGIRYTYNAGSNTANIVSGVLDSLSAGILLYTGLVELLARDFLFNPEMTYPFKQLMGMLLCVLFGAGIMALLGKWA